MTQAVAAGSGLGLAFVLIPAYGAEGAAVAASAGYLIGGATALALLHTRLPFGWREVVPGREDLVAVGRLVAARLPGRAPAPVTQTG